MVSNFYLVCLIATSINLIFLTKKKNKNTDRFYWSMILLMPIIILGYWIKSTVHTVEAAEIANCFLYLDSTVLLILILFSVLDSMNIEVNSAVKMAVYSITAIHLMSIWACRDTTLFYKSITITETSLGSEIVMTDGPLKFTHYIFLGSVFVALFTILIIGFFKKKNYSRKTLLIYTTLAMLGIFVYAIELIIGSEFTVLPGLYTLGSLFITVTYDHIASHDIYNVIGEKQARTGARGFCALDMHGRLLGFNSQFEGMFPDISNVIVDEKIPEEYSDLSDIMYGSLELYDETEEYTDLIQFEDKTYKLVLSVFSVNEGKTKNGYLFEFTDVTEEKKRLDVVEMYNDRLSQEISIKTENILNIQNSVVLGLANMVENRDNNTGGHVKRTSEVIKYLVDEARKQKAYPIDNQKANDIIRAAVMHDLGKISVDYSILCKPGKLTDEEYAVMKTHAPKSGEIVNIILDGVEEQHFVDVAYNLARHHHERWDGKGYPDGLLGESIPIEARIMAVADVYDALVSKRCYKESLSFEKAAQIMNECMGSQFDPAMRPVFVACREKLENYYLQNADL